VTAYLLGIDIGTSGSKALLINTAGKVVASQTTSYPMFTPRPLWAEQNPQDWWEATKTSIKGVLAEAGISASEIAGIGLTGQMHGLVLLDQTGAVIRPCIMWNDQRTMDQCKAVTEAVGLENVLRLTGNQILPGFTAPKIKWVQENEQENYGRIAKVLLPKDYIRYKLSGAFFSEVSDASGTALFDVGQRRWSAEMLEAFDVDRAWLPEVTESPVPSTTVSPEAAAQTGLKAGTPIVGGGGDQAAQAIGTGILREGEVSVTLGTSGVVFAASESYRVQPEGLLHAFCHAVPGMWHLMGVMLSAAGSFRWYRDTLGDFEVQQAAESGEDPYDVLTAAAAEAPAGSEGLIFLPYLTGERTPYPDPNARGVFFGLSLRHTKAHMTRSVLEGVTFGLRDSMELMQDLGVRIDAIRASGGGAKSPLWLNILANIFNTPILTNNAVEGAAFGAALLAGVGTGVYADVFAACDTVLQINKRIDPDDRVGVYQDFYELYHALYAPLHPLFDQDAALVDKHFS
jgi:xylulokinase